MTKLRGIRLDDEVFEIFKNLSIKEGRNYNKTLAILLANHFKSKEESKDGEEIKCFNEAN